MICCDLVGGLAYGKLILEQGIVLPKGRFGPCSDLFLSRGS